MTGSDSLRRFLPAGAVGALAAALASFLPDEYLPYAVFLALLAVVTVAIVSRPVRLIFFIALLAPTIFLIRTIDALPVGGTTLSVSGMIWIFVAAFCAVYLGTHLRAVRIPKILLPVFLFVGWVALRLIVTPRFSGLKDVLFFGLPPLFGVFTFTLARNLSVGTFRSVENFFLATAVLPACAFLAFFALGWETYSSVGPAGIVDSRGVVQYLLVLLAVALARTRRGNPPVLRHSAVWIAAAAVATIVFTLSRMAAFAALLLLALTLFQPRRLRDGLLVTLGLALAGFLVVASVPLLRERFFQNPDADLGSLLLSLRFAGRDVIWSATYEHAVQSPWIGWGPGSAKLIAAEVHKASAVTEYFTHDEYLLVFHDSGLIGLALLLFAYLPLGGYFWRRWKESNAAGDIERASRNWTAFLCVLAVLVVSLTSNTLHYPFITVPAFIFIGFAETANVRAGSDSPGPPDGGA
jgi:O-antigen ligase